MYKNVGSSTEMEGFDEYVEGSVGDLVETRLDFPRRDEGVMLVLDDNEDAGLTGDDDGDENGACCDDEEHGLISNDGANPVRLLCCVGVEADGASVAGEDNKPPAVVLLRVEGTITLVVALFPTSALSSLLKLRTLADSIAAGLGVVRLRDNDDDDAEAPLLLTGVLTGVRVKAPMNPQL